MKKGVSFIRLPAGAQICLYTLDGIKVKTLNSQEQTGRAYWDLTNESGKSVATGIYIYVIIDTAGQQARGKVAIVREYVF